eukprot:116578-Heterocapsa_arctica.AAC.1
MVDGGDLPFTREDGARKQQLQHRAPEAQEGRDRAEGHLRRRVQQGQAPPGADAHLRGEHGPPRLALLPPGS